MLNSSNTTMGLKMQAEKLMKSTLNEQHEALTEVCKIGKVMLLNEFNANFDSAVGTLFSAFGDLVGQDVMADVITRAQRHDTTRNHTIASVGRIGNGKHVQSDAVTESLVKLWESHPQELDPEWTQVSEERAQFFDLLKSCN